MGLRPTHRNESQPFVTPAQAGVHITRTSWIPAPRLRGDKLRGNDVTFDGVSMGLWPTRGNENPSRHPRASGGPHHPSWIPAPRLRGDKLRGNDVVGVIFRGAKRGISVCLSASTCPNQSEIPRGVYPERRGEIPRSARNDSEGLGMTS
jgi:hypothetical protein